MVVSVAISQLSVSMHFCRNTLKLTDFNVLNFHAEYLFSKVNIHFLLLCLCPVVMVIPHIIFW